MTALTLLWLASHCYGSMDARTQSIDLKEVKRGEQRVLVVENKDPYGPRHLSLNFTSRQNITVSAPLPVQAVLAPGEKRELLWVGPENPRASYSYRLSLDESFGDPAAKPDDTAVYLLPWEHGQKHPVGQGYFGAFTHRGIRALDFDMESGTKICAVRDGVVVALKQDSDRGGPSPAYAKDANYVDVLHADGTWATYAHLKLNGALVRLGQKLKAGEALGLSGATGQAAGPHLHFSVQKATYGPEPETLATRFATGPGQALVLEEGHYYYAWHPGGREFKRESAETLDEAALAAKIRPAKGGKLSFRQEKLDNKDLIYCVNGTARRQEVIFDFGSRENVEASQPLPYRKVVPAHSEVFLLSVTMKAGRASYQSRFRSRALP